MEDNLIRITIDTEKAKSILKMVETSLEMIKEINLSKFPSNVTKEYYDVIRELMSTAVLLEGYKTYGEGAHKALIDYIASHYKEFDSDEIAMLDDLRIKRNKICYDGFFVEEDYIKGRLERIQKIISKLRAIINKKL